MVQEEKDESVFRQSVESLQKRGASLSAGFVCFLYLN